MGDIFSYNQRTATVDGERTRLLANAIVNGHITVCIAANSDGPNNNANRKPRECPIVTTACALCLPMNGFTHS